MALSRSPTFLDLSVLMGHMKNPKKICGKDGARSRHRCAAFMMTGALA